ncbi:hypothetical protein N7517_001846 [Penicillium concentricum]|uniref:RBR-type E3 ubiquitin transferase n=1 Tax=Penicillium concentricum TaxID=293559 RepID=A0A9W9VL54_9EURO|nr:uncharacterized protein N7517_001846 [Penicillium concentricum]KAJ5383935.1 hypothetical protein N7517_001846 [Penicillium concentricum]
MLPQANLRDLHWLKNQRRDKLSLAILTEPTVQIQHALDIFSWQRNFGQILLSKQFPPAIVVKCKKSAHRGRCLYQLEQPFEKLIKQNEWQRCNKRGRVIELNQGCPHITMSNFNMGTAMSMGLETENDLSKYERSRSSSKSLPIAIQKLGDSLENAINLDGSPKSEIWSECVSCRDEQPQDDMIKTKCSHFYCKACLIRLFTDSLRDESLFPPQCCRRSIAASEEMIGPALIQKHKEKAIELSDPDRTYCCNSKCAEYLPRKATRDVVCKCTSCGVRTCRKCKKHVHEGRCVYKLDALLEELAECKKWQRCSNCSRLIELSTGCNHITMTHIISDDSDEGLHESSNDVAESEDEVQTLHECVSCTEEYPVSDMIQTECAHSYCRKCIMHLFENSLANNALFPPRCCRLPIRPSTTVEDMIGIEMTKRYKARKTEVYDSHRTYCSNSTCARYILPQNIRRGVGTCEFCTVRTCTDCKKEGHRGDCTYVNANNYSVAQEAEEINDYLLEKLAKKKRWQRCSNCSRMIERISGCQHIRCSCGVDICYKCGKRERNCGCTIRSRSRLHPRVG